jgi:hypothetical protein
LDGLGHELAAGEGLEHGVTPRKGLG